MTTPAAAAPTPEPVPTPIAPVQSAEQVMAQGLMRLAGPLIARYAPWLVAGLGIFGGIEQGSSASRHYEELKATNVELAKKHHDCLEYIVVHEMIHYFERSHGERFTRLMDKHLPDWRSRRDQLNEAPLADETWA